jgi:hypothetical protein
MGWLNFNKPLTKKSLQYDPKEIPKFHSSEVKDLLQASYKRNGDAENIGKKYNLKLDHALSNAEHKVYIDKNGNPDVVFTGTRKFGDVLTDVALATGFGAFTPRFQNSTKLIDKVKEKYKNKPLSVLGHSLGGSLAEHVGKKADKVITLDKGVGLFGIGKNIRNNQTDIRGSNDAVSMFRNTQSGGKKITLKDKYNFNIINAHDIKHMDKINKTL